MQELLRDIERAVRARGWSARQASMRAVGTPELIHNMRRGRVPSVERVKALCEVLGLEFYVGPPRAAAPVDTGRLGRALEITEQALAATARHMSHSDKAQAVSAVYDLMSAGRASTRSVAALIEALARAGQNERKTRRSG